MENGCETLVDADYVRAVFVALTRRTIAFTQTSGSLGADQSVRHPATRAAGRRSTPRTVKTDVHHLVDVCATGRKRVSVFVLYCRLNLFPEDVPSSVELRWRSGEHQAALTSSLCTTGPTGSADSRSSAARSVGRCR